MNYSILTVGTLAITVISLVVIWRCIYLQKRLEAIKQTLALVRQRKDCCPDIMYAAMTPELCFGLFVDIDRAIENNKNTEDGYILMVHTERLCRFSDMALPSRNQCNGQWQWMVSGVTVSGSHQDAVDHLMKTREAVR